MPNSTRRGGRPWRRIRAYVLARDSYLCQLRYVDICTTRATQVDHIEQVAHKPELELDPNNLRAVCGPCHEHRTALQAGGNDKPATTTPSREW